MKYLALLVLPLLCSSCALVQLPARLINAVIAPLRASNDAGTPTDPQVGIAIKYATTPPKDQAP